MMRVCSPWPRVCVLPSVKLTFRLLPWKCKLTGFKKKINCALISMMSHDFSCEIAAGDTSSVSQNSVWFGRPSWRAILYSCSFLITIYIYIYTVYIYIYSIYIYIYYRQNPMVDHYTCFLSTNRQNWLWPMVPQRSIGRSNSKSICRFHIVIIYKVSIHHISDIW